MRQEQLKTGGGPPKSPKRDHVLDIVEGMIPLSTCGLQSTVDSDFMANNVCEDDPDDELQPLNDIFDESTIGDYIVVEDPVLSSHTQEGLSDTVGGSSTIVRPQSATIPESVNVWDRYTPSMLRQAKHPSLQRPQSSLTESGNGPTNWTRRRRPTLPQRQLAAQSVSTTKFASMAEAKADLAILQSEHMKEEREENRKLFNLEVKVKEAQLESLQLDIQLKKTQLEKLQSSHFQN